MIRLFASDLDGTLFNARHVPDAAVLRSVRKVCDAGCHFAIATGRFMRSNDVFGFEGLPIEAVCANGALVYDRHGRLMRRELIDRAFLEELLRAFPTVAFDCTGTRHVYTPVSEQERKASWSRTRGLARILLRGMLTGQDGVWVYDQTPQQILSQDIVKVNARVQDPGLSRELYAFLDEHGDTVVNAPFDPSLFEITNRSVNKGEAVAWLAGQLGIGEDEVNVYGDGGNDIVMLERFAPFGHAYVTRGGCDAAKEAGSEVIGSNALHAVPRHMTATLRRQRHLR